jgi:hypothetical protein
MHHCPNELVHDCSFEPLIQVFTPMVYTKISNWKLYGILHGEWNFSFVSISPQFLAFEIVRELQVILRTFSRRKFILLSNCRLYIQHNNYGCCLAQFFLWASANTFFFNFIIAKTIILFTEMVNFQVRLFENYICCIIRILIEKRHIIHYYIRLPWFFKRLLNYCCFKMWKSSKWRKCPGRLSENTFSMNNRVFFWKLKQNVLAGAHKKFKCVQHYKIYLLYGQWFLTGN